MTTWKSSSSNWSRKHLTPLRETATEHGIDPSDKRLDYGQPGTKFAQRLKTLNKSIREVRAAKDEAEIDSVRQKVPTLPRGRVAALL